MNRATMPLALAKRAGDLRAGDLNSTGRNRPMLTGTMFTRRHLLYAGAAAGALVIARLARPHAASAADRLYEVTHTDEEWHKLLTPAQYNVLDRKSVV